MDTTATTISINIGPRKIDILCHSITDLPSDYDALVSSDDNHLSHSGGVSQAIWSAAGTQLSDELKGSKPRLKLGDVFVSGAGAMETIYLLHAITIDFDSNARIGEGDPVSLFRKLLFTAEELGCSSIAMPLVGSGAAGLSIREATQAFARAAYAWLQSPSSLRHVGLVLGWTLPHEIESTIRRTVCDSVTPETFASQLRGSSLAAIAQSWLQTAHLRTLPRVSTILRIFDGLYAAVGVAAEDVSLTGGSSTHIVGRLAPASSSQVRSTLSEARFVRNKLAHNISAPLPEDLDTVNRGISVLLKWVSNLTEPEAEAELATCMGVASSVVVPPSRRAEAEVTADHEGAHIDKEAVRYGGRTQVSRANIPVGIIGQQQHPTNPVRQLHAFLLENLAAESLAEIDGALERQGYRGSSEMRLLEHIVRVPDPVAFVASEFSRIQLKAALKIRFAIERPGDANDLARELLNAMGFPVPGKLKGLSSALRVVRTAKQSLMLPSTDCDGIVTSVAKHLEFVCHVLLRFVAQAAFSEPPEIVLKNLGKLQGKSDLNSCTLGTLLDCVSAIADAMRTDRTSAAVQIFKSSVKMDDPFPKTTSLAALRNSFAHFKVDAANRCTTESLDDATRFVRDAESFLSYLNGSGSSLFPKIVTIEKIKIDRWGRRLVIGLTDEDEQEGIFTDQDLEPGRVYFMHPLTNPLRVDPILIPAGNLLWLERAR